MGCAESLPVSQMKIFALQAQAQAAKASLPDKEGWYGEGGGIGVQDGEHVYTHGGFMLMYGKTNKINKFKLKKKDGMVGNFKEG